ncbi:bifunctional hydroxymethylpyrimidine kinase/phosphomethylpyrimidine kinase [Paenibacillus harenae]|uniref:bifunctional hydroxymethylpyrimidine kinase/phosphomethylpyrimidine kinase n=1 Tax=Paenibacillus harenae TaxID=306543 RepID=UPI0027D92321|nr:bifunctional hydroxymethylpyrimidine kinase/phosphomethylpyrimidine kinase [Paenibacillus harenae]
MVTRLVIIKGGHVPEEEQRIVDLVYDGKQFSYLESNRIPTRHTHGTGCTYFVALTAVLAYGKTVTEAFTYGEKLHPSRYRERARYWRRIWTG